MYELLSQHDAWAICCAIVAPATDAAHTAASQKNVPRMLNKFSSKIDVKVIKQRFVEMKIMFADEIDSTFK